jgi:hypothetical protein
MSRDPLDELAEQLFAAARAERPDPALTARVSGSSSRLGSASMSARPNPLGEGRVALERPARVTARRRLGWLAVAAIAAGGAAVIGFDSLGGERPQLTLSPEPLTSSAPEPIREEVLEPPRQVEPPEVTEQGTSPVLRGIGEPELPPDRSDTAPARRAPSAPDAAPAKPRSKIEGEGSVKPRAPLAEQLRRLKQARTALRAGDGATALALLESYDAELHGTDLAAEATLLRLEALTAVGRKAEAAALARRFVAENPDSPMVDRARSFIE